MQIHKNEKDLNKRKKEIDQQIYETLILREVGERIGYELSLEKILDTIANSLNKLLPYSVVSYMLRAPDQTKANLRFHLEESVNRKFLDEVKRHMTDKLPVTEVAETITGTIIDEGVTGPVASLWLVPLEINNRGTGVLAVASKKSGLYRGPEMEVLNKILAQANRAVSNLERVLATEEEKLNSMVASMADGVLMLDANMALVVINPAAARLLGLPGEKKLTILDVANSLADKIDLRAKIDESTAGDKVVTFENLRVGDKISLLLISPVKDDSGRKLGSVVLFHDVTARKELERVREEFTAMMVHELRAPLTVVRGTTEMFVQNPALSCQPQGQDLIKTMQNSATTMLTLVNDLLDAAKIEAGKFQILKTPGDLTEIIRDRILFFNQLATPKSIVLSADGVEPDLTAQFDRDRLSQVLNNLISNAIKFTPVGGQIKLSAHKTGSEIEICVTDTGEGIPADKIGDLFSKFKQLHPDDSSGHKGTGLGLVIAKGIVESHGGRIWVESKLNEGSSFHFTIPVI